MRKSRGAMGYVIMIAAFLLLAFVISDSIRVPTNRITYPELLNMIEKSEVDRVSIRGNQLIGRNRVSLVAVSDYPARYDFETTIGADFIDTVRTMYATANDIPVDQVSINNLGFALDYLPPVETPWYLEMLPYLLPMGLVMLFWFYIMRQQTGGGGKVMNFGKSQAAMVDPTKNKITF
ncbi:MAG: hypothetical protein PHP02_09975, partial [Eubacteriales bacterium]|nr:hypothetical protein [Eubacteriales bacterium]